MTPDEHHALTHLMSYFNPNELLVNKALAFGVYPYVNAAECHLYLAKQMWDEANRSHIHVPSMARKEAFEVAFIKRMTEQTL